MAPIAAALLLLPRAAYAESNRTSNGFDYVHLRLWVGPEYLAAGDRFMVHVSHPARFGSALFDGTRSGVAGQVLAGLGFKLEPRLTVGGAIALTKAYAPLHHTYLEQIGTEFDPVLTRRFVGFFADAYPTGRTLGFRAPLHAGGLVGYSWIEEKLASHNISFTSGGYELSLFVGYRDGWAQELYFDVLVRGTVVNMNPLGLFDLDSRPFFGSVVRLASLGLFTGIEFR